MSGPDENNTTAPAAAKTTPIPRMTEEQLSEARARIASYLEDAGTQGINLRPITGQTLRLASQAGLDIERLGSDIDEMDDGDYYDQVVQAAWMLSAEPKQVVSICQACSYHADLEALASEAAEWALTALGTIEREHALVRAFIARWLEYRIEMHALRGLEDEAGTAAD